MPASGMGMPDPIRRLQGSSPAYATHPDFAYIHVLEATDIRPILVRTQGVRRYEAIIQVPARHMGQPAVHR
jgi:hypothetical protein